MVMNYTVHAIMYSYYTLKALKVPVPKVIAMVITSIQLLQMVGGCTVNYLAFTYKQNGRNSWHGSRGPATPNNEQKVGIPGMAPGAPLRPTMSKK